MAGNHSRNKGYRGERELVKILQEAGIKAKRVPLSGATEFQKGDIVFKSGSRQYNIEVKRRHKVNSLLYNMLENSDFGALRADNKGWIVLMPLETFIRLLNQEDENGHYRDDDKGK